MSVTRPCDEYIPIPSDQSTEDPGAVKPRPTPIPKLQLGVICGIRLAEPIAYTQISPYINQFMYDLKVTDDPKRIGFYTGLVQSTFAVFELISIYNMAKISDRVGRRPVILCGILGVALTTLLFGLSTSFYMMLITRGLAGLCAGSISVMQSVVGELTDASNQAIAIPIFGLTWPLGSILGPLLGGTFSNAAQKFNWLDWQFLRTFPYFLPGLISSLVTLVAVLIGYFILEETLPSKLCPSLYRMTSSSSSDTLCEFEETSNSDAPLSTSQLLANPIISALSSSGFALSFLSSGFEELYVLVCFTNIEHGGLGLSTEQIGYSLSISGIVAFFLQLLVMPYILRAFDHGRAYTFCMCLFPCIFVLMPLLNPIAKSGYDASTGLLDANTATVVWGGVYLILGMSRFANLAYSLSMVMLKEGNPSPASLGMCNGIVQSVMCLARAFSPAMASSLYAYSVGNGALGGFAWALFMLAISLAGVYQTAVTSTMARSKGHFRD
ncbi:MFS general substrate transporter [Athelia psychrophila]|uniref:MFS general substrate transporter n=1 Tax=Athelia psychrophila TaxID=1759441 RepID=A0A166VEI0_9AGAM|nr:MFS general substrate transporter [Fibularhizoctonia sp. CBS 109695]